MDDQKTKILKMVEEGKLTAEEATRLLAAMEPPRPKGELELPKRKARFLKIRVFEGDMDRPKVNVTLPLALAKAVTKVLPKSARVQLQDKDIDLDALLSVIDDHAGQKLVDVRDEEDNTHVEIMIE